MQQKLRCEPPARPAQNFPVGARWGRLLALLALLLTGGGAAWAQSSANYAFSTSTTGSLALDRNSNVVDMSTGTTQLVAADLDDNNGTGLQTLPISFTFMGTSFTQFSATSNGLLGLGSTAVSASAYTVSTGTAALPIISAFGGDLRTGISGKVHYKTVGTAPNRTLVVEFLNMSLLYAATPGPNNGTYQVRLYEATGTVEFVYGAMFRNSGTTALNSQQVGIGFAAGSTAGKLAYILSATNANTNNSATFTQQTYTVSTNIPNLNSAADGSRRVYTYVPPSPVTAPTTLSASGATPLSQTVNFVDASTNEVGFAVYRSTDNVAFTQVGTVASTTAAGTGTTYSYNDSGLSAGTTYYYRVAAYSEGVFSSFLTGPLATPAAVPLCGTYSVGPTGTYASLTSAFQALAGNGISCAVVFELQAAYASTVETFPLAYTFSGGSATNTVTVRPAAGATGRSISSASTTATLNISGGKYLILDGRPGGSGLPVTGATDATNDLTIGNTNTSGIAINFASDATNNTVQHCQVKGVGSSISYPNINFSSTATAGNSNNVIQYNNVGDGATTPAILVYSGSSTNANNTIANNNLFNFYYSSTATAAAVYLSSAGSGWNISNNSLYQTASRTPGGTTQYGLYLSSGTNASVSGNYIGGSAALAAGTAWTVSATTAAYRFVGIYVSGTTPTVQNNTIANMSWYSSSGATTAPGTWAGIYALVSSTIQGNTIGNGVTITTTTSGGISYGIVSSTGPATLTVNGNTVAGITMAGSTTAIANSVAGIQTAGTTNNVYQNKIYGLAAANAGLATGILAFGGTTTNIYNNLVGNLTASASTSLLAVTGLNIAAGTVNAYYNTIYLNASGGATFGTSGIYLSSTSATFDARNNIVVNTSTAAGSGGFTAAFRRVSGTANTVPANYATTSNNNLFYAGTPSATNLIYVEGTTATVTNVKQTLADYKLFMGNRDQAAITELPPFASTTGSAATFLHIATGTSTQVESGGTASLAGYTTDYDGDPRFGASGYAGTGSATDIGADEGNFTPNDLTPPAITYTALANTGNTGSRTLSVTITDASGIATGAGAPLLYYRVGTTGAYTSVAATTAPTAAPYTGTYTFTIPGAATGSTVQYYVAAQDANANANNTTSPSGGSGTNPPGSTAPTTPNSYQVLTVLTAGTYYVGTGTSCGTPTYATLTAAVADYNSKGLSGGAVTFVLVDNTYAGETYPITINANGDANATNTLTIKPCSSATPSFSGSTAGPLLVLNGAQYVTLDGSNAGTTTQNWTLANTSTSTSAALVLLTSNAGGTTASNNTVRNLVLTGAASTTTFTTAYGVQLLTTTGATAGATGNTIRNNAITKVQTGITVAGLSAAVRNSGTIIASNQIGSATTAAGFGGTAAKGIAATNENSLTITGNVVRNPVIVAAGAPSVIASGGSTTAAATALLSATSVIGIDLTSNITTATVANNTVRDLLTSGGTGATTPLAGVRVGASVASATVNANLITNLKTTTTSGYGSYGIEVATGSSATAFNAAAVVSNNMVSDLNGSNYSAFGNGSTAGIYLYSTASLAQSGISVVYNSVNIYGSSTYGSTTATATAGLAVETGSTGLTVQNNALSNSLVAYNSDGTANTLAKPYAFFSNAAASAYTALNNNDYYSSGIQAVDGSSVATSVVVYFGSAARYSLAAVQTATGMDAASITANPQFTAPNDLHTTASALAAGAPIAGITTDFDGDTRSTTIPAIGADEAPGQDVGIVALTAPAATICYAGAQPITVTIRNYGTTAATASIPVSVVVTFPNSTTATVTGTYSGAAIAAGGTVNFTVGTYTVNGSGTYLFNATTTYVADSNPANNALAQQSVSVTVPPTITIAASPATTVCTNSTVTLTASDASYIYTWTSTTGGNLASTTGTSVTATPSQTATYTATGTNGTCNVTATITITVNPAPVVTVAPVTSTICNGGTQVLTASGPATTATIGTGTSATDIGDVSESPYGLYYKAGRYQYLILASELTAAGFQAGDNLNSLAFNVATNNATYAYSNFSISLANTSATALTGTFISTGLTQVVAPTSYTTTSGLNTHAFSTAFTWTGGNLVVSTSYGLNSNYSDNSTVYYTITPFTSVSLYSSDSNTSPATQATASYTSTARPNIRFTRAIPATTYNWEVLGGGNGLPATTNTATITVNPSQTSVYRVTATFTGSGCASTATSTVTVNPRPTAAVTASPASVNPGGTSTVSIALTGTAPFTFTYTTNGANPVTVTGTSTNPYTFTTAALSVSTTYAVTALSDANCTATSADLTNTSPTVTVTAPPVDIAVQSLFSPATATVTCPNPTQAVTVRILNNGTQDLDFSLNPVTVTATVTGPNPQTFSTTLNTGTLTTNTAQDVTLATAYDMSAVGTYTFALQASTSPQDSNPGNDTRTETRTVAAPAAVTVTPASSTICVGNSQTLTASVASSVLLPAATFDSGTDGFTVTTGTGNTSGAEFVRAVAPYTNTYTGGPTSYNGPSGASTGGFFIANNGNSSTTTSNTQLTSPAFSTVGYANATLSFQQYYKSFTNDVTAKVEYSLNGTAWTQLASYVNTTSGTATGAQTPITIALPAAALGQPNVQVRFNYNATYGYYWAIDNVGVTSTPATTYAWSVVSGDGLPTTTTTAAISVTPTQNSVYRVTATSTATGCSTTATASVNVTAETVWTGAVSTAWLTSGNWTACVPSATISARIPAGLTTYPTVSAASVTKNLTIEAGATLTQTASTLQVWGDLTNSGTATLTGGTIAFRAAVPQMVTGVMTFNNLTVNQAATASTVTLANDMTVNNNLTLTAGVLNTGTYTVTLPTGASLVSETDANYVLGRVSVTGRSLAAGTAQTFGGIGLTLTPATGSTAPGLTPVVRTTGTILTGIGTSQSIQRYYDIQPAVNTGLNVTMAFSYLDHERNGIAAASMQLFRSTSGTSGPWERQFNTTISANTVTKTGITDFSIWTLGSADNPLPVTLTKFEAVRQGSNAALSWTTASEVNNQGFDVQVSTDGQAFRKLGFVAGAGNSQVAHSYSFLDQESGKASLRYYRLRQVDFSGQENFSPIRTVQFEAVAGLVLQALPNPFTGSLALRLTLPKAGKATVVMTDALGRVVSTQDLGLLPAGTSQPSLTGIDGLATGVYVLRVSVAGGVHTLKVVKE